ncbi:hypothetical protein [Ascidiaceihabitans sp.]|uniref:hypothetical protein n=1 Tax=Ascidiaceihabitans sp. TaxID=1872644 RepID=UPI0032992199
MNNTLPWGFSKWHWRIFKMHGLAKKIGVERDLLESWFSQHYGDPTTSWPQPGLARSFKCGPLIEFNVGHVPIIQPNTFNAINSRWHIYRHKTAKHQKGNIDAYFGNLHINWGGRYVGGSRSGQRKVDDLELCILPIHQQQLLDALWEELLVYKLST